MRALFLLDRFPAAPGGVKTVVVELARAFRPAVEVELLVPRDVLRKRGREPLDAESFPGHVIDYAPSTGDMAVTAPARYVNLRGARRYGHGRAGLPAARYFGAVSGLRIARQLAPKPDLVHVFSADVTAHVGLGIGRALRAPVVCTGFPHVGQYGDGPIDRAAYRRADKVVALTGYDKQVYVALGVDPERVTVIPPPSRDLSSQDRQMARERLGISGPVVLFAGARRPYKGVDIVCDAAEIVARELPVCTFAFVGPGDAVRPLYGAILRDAREVDEQTMGEWIAAADVLVLPSAHEICPIVVLEAWSAGIPVVTSDIPALQQLVGDAGGGVVVPRRPQAVAEALSRLLADDAQRHGLGSAGRSYWERHCAPSRIVDRHLEIYSRCLS